MAMPGGEPPLHWHQAGPAPPGSYPISPPPFAAAPPPPPLAAVSPSPPLEAYDSPLHWYSPQRTTATGGLDPPGSATASVAQLHSQLRGLHDEAEPLAPRPPEPHFLYQPLPTGPTPAVGCHPLANPLPATPHPSLEACLGHAATAEPPTADDVRHLSDDELLHCIQWCGGFIKACEQAMGERRSCSICFDRRRCVVFLPCRHEVTCKECGDRVRQCPVCRSPITDRVVPFR
eukprot:EG_transcript_20259